MSLFTNKWITCTRLEYPSATINWRRIYTYVVHIVNYFIRELSPTSPSCYLIHVQLNWQSGGATRRERRNEICHSSCRCCKDLLVAQFQKGITRMRRKVFTCASRWCIGNCVFIYILRRVIGSAERSMGDVMGQQFFIITYELEKKKPLSGSEGWNQGIVLRPRLWTSCVFRSFITHQHGTWNNN